MTVDVMQIARNRRLRLSLNALLAVAAAAMFGAIAVGILRGDGDDGSPVVRPQPAAVQSLSWRWFSGSGSAPRETASAALEEASIDAELLGIMTAGGEASATIRVANRPEAVYQVGDELQRDVVVRSISPLRVVLDERGRTVQLSMPVGAGLVRRVPAPPDSDAQEPREGITLANLFSAVPVRLPDNNGTGLRVDGLSEEMRGLTDIRDGDVIVSIGGTRIDELMNNSERWMQYSAETSLPVTVLRDGIETQLTVNAFSLSARVLPSLTNELMQ